MKKVLIIAALISVNQAFATTPAKSTDPKTTKTVVASTKKTTSPKATTSKVNWYLGTAAVTATTDNTGCGGSGGGSWGWFRGWFRH
jgi:hypothetical protein